MIVLVLSENIILNPQRAKALLSHIEIRRKSLRIFVNQL